MTIILGGQSAEKPAPGDWVPAVTISLCMIVKNEADTLTRCLDSVKELVDEIIIVDTGSTDETRTIAKRYTPKVFDFEWQDDFSAARNYSFQQATMNYIMWLDADDVLLEADREKFRRLKLTLDPSVDSVTMLYHLSFDEQGNVAVSSRQHRLVKRDKGFQWTGAAHEVLMVEGNIFNSDIAVTHRKPLDRYKRDQNRTLEIYKRRLERGDPFTPRDVYYFANELKDHERYKEAVQFYKIFLQMGMGWIEDVIGALVQLADCYDKLKDNKKVKEVLMQAVQLGHPRAEIYCRLGDWHLKNDEVDEAIGWFELAIGLEKPDPLWGYCEDAYWTWYPHTQLCICYAQKQEYQKAYEHNEKARQTGSHNEKMLEYKTWLEQQLNGQVEGDTDDA
jgi:glycosyltransferase involved in cell wall biosynthesis